MRELVERRGCELLFLPPYSPDLNPIEQAFSKVKALLRKAAIRTRESLIGAIGRALSAVKPEDVKGWFAHCGYEALRLPSSAPGGADEGSLTGGATATFVR